MVTTAGSSAAARAAELRARARRGVWRRVLSLMGVSWHTARADARAGRWDAGALGEKYTAELLRPLAGEGWYGLYDRALPRGGRANADFVLIPPCGRLAVNVDAKLWSGRYRVHCQGGPLFHGTADRARAVNSILYESREIAAGLGVRVVPVTAVWNAPVEGGRFETCGVTVLPSDALLGFLRRLSGPADPRQAEALAQRAAHVLRPYQR